MAIRVLVVDDDAGFRRAARELLHERGYEVVGEAAGTQEALATAALLDPDAVLLDVGLPDGDGLELADRLCDGRGHPRVLLTSSDLEAVPLELLQASSARGFVPKADIAAADLDLYFRS
jgi:DNA-binding NarL/FixJ family response regulator